MIKNGNYSYLDLHAHKDKFIDIACEYYGEEYRQQFEKDFENLKYIPYMNFGTIANYYNKYILQFKDEIIAEYMRLSGRKTLTDEQKHFLMNDSDYTLESSIREGRLLYNIIYREKDKLAKLQNHRLEVAKAFGILGNGQYILDELHKEVRYLAQAKRNVENAHKCDTFVDIQRYRVNSMHALQSFLLEIGKNALSLSKNDYEILSRPEFDICDRENLDCKYILFGGRIDKEGLISSFTSTEEKTLKTMPYTPEACQVLEYRLQYFYFNDPGKTLTFVTEDEIFIRDEDAISDFKDYFIRLSMQYEAYKLSYPNVFVHCSTADSIEQLRKDWAKHVYDGCLCTKPFLRDIDGSSINYEDKELDWFSSDMSYYDNPFQSHKNIVFDEGNSASPLMLLEYIIHELNHIYSFSNRSIKPTRFIKASGFHEQNFRLDKDCEIKNEVPLTGTSDLTNTDENIDQLVTIEMLKLFLDKYPNIFEEYDISFDGIEDKGVLYAYWDILTRPFFDYFKEHIKKYRIDKSYPFYFDNEGIAVDTSERIINLIKSKYNRITKPTSFSQNGVVDLNKVIKLNRLITKFRKELVPIFQDFEIVTTDIEARKGNYLKLPHEVKAEIVRYQRQAKEIIDSMIRDYEIIQANKENPQPNQTLREKILSTASTAKEKIMSLLTYNNPESVNNPTNPADEDMTK